jgi:predicted ATP-dependent endonuclease of OLD family
MYVDAIHLENIKAFEALDLNFRRPNQVGQKLYAGLNFFVGGNASGKSTLLKCIAMGLTYETDPKLKSDFFPRR